MSDQEKEDLVAEARELWGDQVASELRDKLFGRPN